MTASFAVHRPEILSVDARPGWRGSLAFYQEPAFAELFAAHHGLEVAHVDGVLVLVRRRPLLGNMRGFIAGAPVASPFAPWWSKVEALRCSEVELHTIEDVPALHAHRVTSADTYSFLLDLRLGEDALWARLEGDCRKAIRKGRRQSLAVREAQDGADLEAFYTLLSRASRGGAAFAIAPLGLLQRVLRSRFGKLLLAVGHRQVVGGVFYLTLEDCFAWFSCFERELMPDTPGNLIHWENIRWAIAQGLRYYDFGAQSLTDKPNLTLFKKSFGPDLVPAYAFRVPQSRLKRSVASLGKRLGA